MVKTLSWSTHRILVVSPILILCVDCPEPHLSPLTSELDKRLQNDSNGNVLYTLHIELAPCPLLAMTNIYTLCVRAARVEPAGVWPLGPWRPTAGWPCKRCVTSPHWTRSVHPTHRPGSLEDVPPLHTLVLLQQARWDSTSTHCTTPSIGSRVILWFGNLPK